MFFISGDAGRACAALIAQRLNGAHVLISVSI